MLIINNIHYRVINFTCKNNTALLVEEFHNEAKWKSLTLRCDT